MKVTGASSGIGYALAEQCVENGFDVLVCSDTPAIEVAARQLERDGASAFSAQEDLSGPDGVERLYQRIEQIGRPVDALLLNAGVGVGGPFVETPLDLELNIIALNCCHTIHLAKRVLQNMVKLGKGRVLITGSVASTAPAPFQAVYGATKAFVYSFALAIREELKDTGVTVTLVQPRMEDTKVGQDTKDDARDGFDAMMAGKASIVAGSLKSRAQGALNEMLPETAKAKLYAKEAEPGSGKH